MSRTHLPLSEDLEYWILERPNEWTMKEFLRKAKKLEEERLQLISLLEVKTTALQNMIDTYQHEASMENPTLLAAKEVVQVTYKDVEVLGLENVDGRNNVFNLTIELHGES